MLNAQGQGQFNARQTGYKGSIVHMPMNVHSTLNHVVETLPSLDNFRVAVATSRRNISKLLSVDLEKVHSIYIQNSEDVFTGV